MRGGLAGQGPRGGMGAIDGRLIAGTNVTLDPTNGVGNVTINATGGGGGVFTTVTTTGNITDGGNLSVAGTTSLVGTVTTTGNVAVGGTLGVTGTSAFTGASTFASTVTVTGGARFNGGIGVGADAAISGVYIVYNNNDPSAPGFILNSTAASGGDAVMELRVLNATMSKWRADDTGDAFLECGKGFGLRVNTQGSVINVLTVTNAGDVGMFGTPSFNFDCAKAKTGTLYSAIRNSSVGAGTDNAYLLLQVGSGAGGDPGIQFNVSGVSDWAAGVDNSDNDNFAIGVSTTIGSALRLKLASAAPTSGNTSMTVAYHNGTTATSGLITLGAADSGGSGFKVLRVPN